MELQDHVVQTNKVKVLVNINLDGLEFSILNRWQKVKLVKIRAWLKSGSTPVPNPVQIFWTLELGIARLGAPPEEPWG